jgi:hypothetical protein
MAPLTVDEMSMNAGSPSPPLEAALQKRDELHRDLVAFERSLAAPARGREAQWLAGVQGAAVRLRDTFADHVMVTEGGGGLFDEIMSEAPRLAHHIDLLRQEHREISAEISRVAATSAGDPDEIRKEALVLFSRLAHHRQKGADLLYDAYDVDLGGE